MRIHKAASILGFACVMLPRLAVAQTSPVSRLAQDADAIVIGKATAGTAKGTALSVSLQIDRVLKGTTSAVSIPATATIMGDVGKTVQTGCGIWFLKESNGQWTVQPVEAGPVMRSLHMPLASCSMPQSYTYTAQASAVDKVLTELAASAEASQGKNGQSLYLFRALRGSGSPVEDQVVQRLSASTAPELRAVSFGLQIAKGEPAGLNRTELEISTTLPPEARAIYVMALGEFTATEGVPALSRLATSTAKADLPIQRAAATALKRIHNAAALSVLYVLLDHSDREIRENAVSGFSLFRLGIPAGLKGGAFDHAVLAAAAPGSSVLSAEKDREGIHLGPFASPAEESTLIAFYKSWWPQNASRF